MITKISLNDIATYTSSPQVLDCHPRLNFVYGANGSGKTTLSKIIKHPSISLHSSVSNTNLDAASLVYNIDFVKDSFEQDIKGIFTLGADDKAIFDEIKVNKGKIDSLKADSVKKGETLHSKKDELAKKYASFVELSWNLKTKVDSELKPTLTGCRKSGDVFARKCIEICKGELGAKPDYDALVMDIALVYGKNVEKLSPIPSIIFNKQQESDWTLLLKNRVIGKDNVELSSLIQLLGNEGWVMEGQDFLDKSGDRCPFFQEEMTRDLRTLLTDFFDKTYTDKLRSIADSSTWHDQVISQIINSLTALVDSQNAYLDHVKMALHLQKIITVFNENSVSFNNKSSTPADEFVYINIDNEVTIINELISDANSKINDHNKKIDNAESEKQGLVIKTWAYIGHEINGSYLSYRNEAKGITSAVKGIESAIGKNNQEIDNLNVRQLELEEKITSTEHTVNEMNNILSGYHFSGFKLAQGEEKGTYKVVRTNGQDAKKTLSEGEKTFVTFLYFYHLLKGSVDKGGISKDRIVVFDDPISSLDSNVLFIVSNLVRKLFDEVKADHGFVKQIFVLTHNVYFHKEITYQIQDCKYWVVSKLDNVSTIKEYTSNPIRSSYQLLWQELKEIEPRKSITIPNVLRRILENYFKIMGKMNFDTLIELFEGEKQILCKALISWTHDGSHNLGDDLYLDASDEVVDKYLLVFKEVFDKSGHVEHYNMMMSD